MAEDDIAAAEIGQHGGADAAGMGAGFGLVAILPAQGDGRSGERAGDRVERSERREHRDIAGIGRRSGGGGRFRERDGLGAQPVHLPVAGDQRLGVCHLATGSARVPALDLAGAAA